MGNKISKIYENSIAEELGIEVGDKLISINDTPVKDIIDYKFLIADDYLEVEIEKADGEVWVYEIDKDYEEDLGLEFHDPIMDKAKSCTNKCVFCFIDQLPKGMRETLYFKDDDSRLSFLQGNFVTLTNLKEEDIDRIIRYRISPINISVHTTNPDLRVKMLNNRFAGEVYNRLKRMAEAGIEMNAQIVVCPGLNNGKELVKTINDLYALYPSVQNVAAVPVGVTRYREGLYPLTTYTKETAAEEINLINSLQKNFTKEIGSPFVRLSDEFYVVADLDVPDEDFYGEYEQLEDGVGMIRLLRETINIEKEGLRQDIKGEFTFITGVSAFNEIENVAKTLMDVNNSLKINAYKIINNFFGETITVAGLLTGKDIIEQLNGKSLGKYLIISRNMLRAGEKVFLDDITVEDMEKALNVEIVIVNYTGEGLVNIINNLF